MSTAPADQPAHTSPWRFGAGAVYGLTLAAILSIFLTLIADPVVAGTIEYGDDGLLYSRPVAMGLTASDLHAYFCVGGTLLLPLLGVVVQYKPLLPQLSSGKSFLVGIPVALVAVSIATYIFLAYVSNWMWLTHS